MIYSKREQFLIENPLTILVINKIKIINKIKVANFKSDVTPVP